MKKLFTLISVALATMSVNAQDKYEAITYTLGEDGKIATLEYAPEFKAVVTDAEGNVGTVANNVTAEGSVVNITVGNVTVKAVGGSTPADVPDDPTDADGDGKADNTEDTHVDINADGTVNSWNKIEWKNGKNNDCLFAWIQGTGNPGAIVVKPVVTDGVQATYFYNGEEHLKWSYDIETYKPDGSLGCPKNGLHYQFTAAVAGTMKIGIWANKGNRNTFVVDGTTALPVEYKAEGYINGKKDADGKMIYFTTEQLDSLHMANKNYVDSIRNEAGVATGEVVDIRPYVIGPGNQAFFGYITFEMEAGKTYYVFGDNWQIGFNGFEFTAGAAAGPEIPANAIYYWESPEGTPVEKGGKIENKNSEDERLNYSNSGYHTICLNGKLGNLNDTEASKNASHMVLTLDQPLQKDDVIEITGYRTKNADGKNASIYFLFENGTEWKDEKAFVNICTDEAGTDYDNDGSTPNTNTWTITDAEAGSKTITMTRNQASTNIFITKFVITRGGTDGIASVETVTVKDNVMYNLSGQKVDANFKGIVIMNGKKFMKK